jgi:hypothetical protein
MAKKIIGVTVGTPISPQAIVDKSEQAQQIVQNTEDISNKQDRIDNDLETTDKTIVGAINEIKSMTKDIANIKDFSTVQFDPQTRMLKFLDENGDDVYNPVYIEGGGTGGSSGGNVIKLLNASDFTAKTIPLGEKTELSFTYISTDDGVPTGNGTCQITVNGVVKKTMSVPQGTTNVDVTEYLSAGLNDIKVKCTDIYGYYKILNYTLTAIDLRITSTFDDTLTYNDVIQFKYIPYGTIEKTVHILLDGKPYSTTTVSASGKQSTLNIEKQSHGVHTIEAYITAQIDTEELESLHLKYDVLCIEEGNTDVLIASSFTSKTVEQGTLLSIPYVIYNPSDLSTEITLIVKDGDEEYSSQTITVDRQKQYWNVRRYPVGNPTFTIKCGDVEKVHTVAVTEAQIDVEPVTNDLELMLTSQGRSNNEALPFIWTYGDISTTFNKVNWDSTGWVVDDNGDSVLRLNGGATAEILFKPFKDDLRLYGKTIEIEFAVRDVNNRDAVVLSCMNDGIGIEMTADTATLTSEQSSISCNYRDEEKFRVALVVESKSEYRLLQVYLNGVLSATKQYPANDNFQQATPMNIKIGSPYCGVDIYTIRSYSNALTFDEIIDNYIADIPDIIEKKTAYDANNLYDEYKNLKYDLVKEKIPVMTIVGDLPQSKGDKKNVVIKFEHNTDDTLSFEDSASIDVQGTSSQWYIRKNYKEKLSEPHLHAVGQMPSRIFCTKADYAESTGTHNTQNANLVETLYSEKTPAQLVDDRCRTTIFGYPIVIFHQSYEGATPEFIGKYNFNFDKGSTEVYGFDGSFDAESWEFKNNTSDACNFLAKITTGWQDNFEARYPEDNKDISRFKVMHDWVVSTKGNITKFRNEFEEYFDLHFTLIYYVYTTVMLMVDQRAKNMFLTYWADTGKWQPWFYDNDTSCGINNEGHLVFDYYHEDIDTLDGANVYNGQNSVLWTNFRQAFADEIKETYQQLRNDGKLTYDKIIEYFVTNGSDKWSAAIYNEDADYKYISMLRNDNDASNLYQVRGTGEAHLKYFIQNRLNYLDSKWYASDYADNYVTLRIYTPSEWAGIEPNANVTVTPFSNMYAGVRYKANGTLEQKRVEANEVTTFEAPNETFNDTETAIYGASEISSLGDLSPLYCGTVNVSKASRLINLKIGDATEGYVNTNLKTLSVGTNRLLKTIDVRNCPSLTDPLALSGCPNIEEIYATGSGITGVELPHSGYLRVVHLPRVTNLTLKNQLYIDDLTVEGYDNVSTLNIENCPSLDELDILEQCTNISRVRLTNVDWSFDDATFLIGLVNNGIKGIDENGLNVDIPQISGKCHIKELSGSDMADIKAYFPYLTITYDTLTATIIYMSEDGTQELYREIILNGGDSTYAGTTPTKESTVQYDYSHIGWSSTAGGNANESITKNVITNRTVYAVFSPSLRKYTIRFLLGTEVLQSSLWEYGSMPTYNGSDPIVVDYVFMGWQPEISIVTGNLDYQANMKYTKSLTRAFIDRSILEYSSENVTVVQNNAFYNCTSLESVNLPNVTTVDADAFRGCISLKSVNLPNATTLTQWCFIGCESLELIDFPKLTQIANTNGGTFSDCKKLTTVILRSNTLCKVQSSSISSVFSNTPIANGTGYVYVPKTLVDSYKSDSTWSTYKNQFRAIEDYPEICGGDN